MLRRSTRGLLVRLSRPLLQGWGSGGADAGGGWGAGGGADAGGGWGAGGGGGAGGAAGWGSGGGGGAGGAAGWGDGASAGGGGAWGESAGGGGGGWGSGGGGGGRGGGGGGWGSSGGWGDGDGGWRNAPVGGRRGAPRGNFRRGRGGGGGGGGVWGQPPTVDEESWNVASPSFQPPVRRVDPLTLTAVEVEIDGVKKLVGQRVQVTGISDDTRWQTLKDHLRQAGEVTFCRIFSSGRAVVEFTTPEDAARAITELQGSDLEGSTIFLREDREDTVLVNTRRKIREAREAQLREKKKEAEEKRRKEAMAQGDVPDNASGAA